MFSTSFKDPELARTDKAISLEQNAARLYKNQMFLDADEMFWKAIEIDQLSVRDVSFQMQLLDYYKEIGSFEKAMQLANHMEIVGNYNGVVILALWEIITHPSENATPFKVDRDLMFALLEDMKEYDVRPSKLITNMLLDNIREAVLEKPNDRVHQEDCRHLLETLYELADAHWEEFGISQLNDMLCLTGMISPPPIDAAVGILARMAQDQPQLLAMHSTAETCSKIAELAGEKEGNKLWDFYVDGLRTEHPQIAKKLIKRQQRQKLLREAAAKEKELDE